MKNVLIICILFSTLFGAEQPLDSANIDQKVTEKNLAPCEKVLAGVLLLNDSFDMSVTKKHEYYIALLKETKVTHEQFQRFLTAQKNSSKEWTKTLDRLNIVFQ